MAAAKTPSFNINKQKLNKKVRFFRNGNTLYIVWMPEKQASGTLKRDGLEHHALIPSPVQRNSPGVTGVSRERETAGKTVYKRHLKMYCRQPEVSKAPQKTVYF